MIGFNARGVWAIYRFEMKRFFRTVVQSLISPVISTALYFIVFGSAIGGRMEMVDGIAYAIEDIPVLPPLKVAWA